MENKIRTLNDLTIDELNGVITDLQSGVRYNDIKTKYNIPKMVFSYDTIDQCKKLIAELTPAPSVKTFTGYYGIQNTTPEEHADLIARGVVVDENGYYCW